MDNNTLADDLDKINLHKKHPLLYELIVYFALARVAWGLNFWWSSPAFQPYGIPYGIVGLLFFLTGVWQLVFLHKWRSLRKIRIGTAVSAGLMMAWGLVNTQQIFAGNASWQLPIAFVVIALVQRRMLFEAPVNPMTEKA